MSEQIPNGHHASLIYIGLIGIPRLGLSWSLCYDYQIITHEMDNKEGKERNFIQTSYKRQICWFGHKFGYQSLLNITWTL